jgi:DnaJ-domain-containing protein 1
MVYIRDEIIKKNEEDFKKSFKLDRFKKAKWKPKEKKLVKFYINFYKDK